MENVSLPNKKNVKLFEGEENEKTLVIQKLGLGRYSEMLDIANNLMKKVFTDAIEDFKIDNPENDQKLTEESFLVTIITSMGKYRDDILNLIHIATYDKTTKNYQLTIDELCEDVGMEEAIDIITAILEVNKLFEVFDNIKKFKATIMKK